MWQRAHVSTPYDEDSVDPHFGVPRLARVYDALDPDNLRAIVIRMSLLLTGLMGAFSFFAVVPRTKTWFTSLGSATLVVYLFHGFVVLSAEFAGFPGWANDHMPFAWLLTTIVAVLLALLLAWAPVSTRLNVLVDPVGALARRRRGRVPTSA